MLKLNKLIYGFLVIGVLLGTVRFINAQTSNNQAQNKNKPKVLQSFDESKNETTVFVSPGIGDIMFKQTFGNTGLAAQTLSAVGRPGAPGSLKIGFILADAYYKLSGKTLVRPQTISFTFLSDEGKDKYKDNLDFSINVGDEQMSQGKMEYSQRTTKTSNTPIIEEILKVTIPTEVFLRIAKEKNVRFQLGSKNYKMKEAERERLKDLAEFIEQTK